MTLDKRFLTPEEQELEVLREKIERAETMLADDTVSPSEKKTLRNKLNGYHKRLPTAQAVAKAARGRRPTPRDVRNRRMSGMMYSARRSSSVGSASSARSARSTRSAASKASILDAMDNFMKDEAVEVIEQRSAAKKAARKLKLDQERRLDEQVKARKQAEKMRARKEAEANRVAGQEELSDYEQRLANAIKARKEAEAKLAKATEARKLAEEKEKEEAENKQLDDQSATGSKKGILKKTATSTVGKKKKDTAGKKGKIKKKKKGAEPASTSSSDDDDLTAATEPVVSESFADFVEEYEKKKKKKKKGRSRSLSISTRESTKVNKLSVSERGTSRKVSSKKKLQSPKKKGGTSAEFKKKIVLQA